MGRRLHTGKHRFCPRTKSGYENCRGRRNPQLAQSLLQGCCSKRKGYANRFQDGCSVFCKLGQKETIRSELFNAYKKNTGLDAYDIQEISPVEYEKLRQNGMEELSGEEYNN